MRAEQLSHRGRVLSHSLTEGKKEKESQLSPDDKQQILNGHDARQAKGIGIRKVEKGRDKANRGARKENLRKMGEEEKWNIQQTSRSHGSPTRRGFRLSL